MRKNKLSFLDFLWLGREQWITCPHPLARVFIRWLGPLGIHTRIRSAHILQVIEKLPLPPKARVLDAGCGHAYASFWLARHHTDWEIWGVDINAEIIKQNQRAAYILGLRNLHFQVGDVTALNISVPYDLLFSIDVLEHLRDDVRALSSWRQAINQNGWLVLHVPLRHQMQKRIFPAFRHHTVSDHLRDEYTEDEIKTKLRQAGFVLLSTTYGFGTWGELAFELNYLFWQQPWLRTVFALLTFPIANIAGYIDSQFVPDHGNSLILLAQIALP